MFIRDKFTNSQINGVNSKVTGFTHDITTYVHSAFTDNDDNQVNTAKIYDVLDDATNGYLDFDFVLCFMGIQNHVNVGRTLILEP